MSGFATAMPEELKEYLKNMLKLLHCQPSILKYVWWILSTLPKVK